MPTTICKTCCGEIRFPLYGFPYVTHTTVIMCKWEDSPYCYSSFPFWSTHSEGLEGFKQCSGLSALTVQMKIWGPPRKVTLKKLHNKLVAKPGTKPSHLCFFHDCSVTKSGRYACHQEAKFSWMHSLLIFNPSHLSSHTAQHKISFHVQRRSLIHGTREIPPNRSYTV